MKYSFVLFFLIFSFVSIAQTAEKKTTAKPSDEDPETVLPVLIRGPYLQRATPVSIMIRWRTDALSRSRVYIGTEPDKLSVAVTDSMLVTEHKILVTSLQSATKYYYSIGDVKNKLQGDTANYFYTLPPSGATGTYRIAAFGDCGNNSINQRNVRDQLLKYMGNNYLNAWLLVGDNAYPDCTDAEFQQNFFNIYKDNLLKKYPLFPAPGNHDYHDKEFSQDVAQKSHEVAYYQNFSMPMSGESGGVASHTSEYYSFDIGNIHFLSIDSYGMADGKRLSDTTGPQAEWIKKDLEQAAGAEWIVAYWHHPPYTMGSHNCDKEDDLVDIRQNFIPMLERYGVDIVINGHSHDYERSRMMSGYYGKYEDFDSAKYVIGGPSGKKKGGSQGMVYQKNQIRGKGTVYVVTGSSGKLGGMQPTYPHKALPFSDATHGGVSLIEVSGNRLTFRWICADGVIRDQFVMIKGSPLVISK
jgi:acid phosphatase type 7